MYAFAHPSTHPRIPPPAMYAPTHSCTHPPCTHSSTRGPPWMHTRTTPHPVVRAPPLATAELRKRCAPPAARRRAICRVGTASRPCPRYRNGVRRRCWASLTLRAAAPGATSPTSRPCWCSTGRSTQRPERRRHPVRGSRPSPADLRCFAPYPRRRPLRRRPPRRLCLRLLRWRRRRSHQKRSPRPATLRGVLLSRARKDPRRGAARTRVRRRLPHRRARRPTTVANLSRRQRQCRARTHHSNSWT